MLLFLFIIHYGKAYFPAESMAFNPEGHKILLKDLKVGDSVISFHSNGTLFNEKIISMSRQNPNKESIFIRIAYLDPSDKQTVRGIHVSPNHLILIGKHAIQSSPAKEVKAGDKIVIYLKGYVTVISVDVVRKVGAFSPITDGGRILIDGVLVSCYEDFPSHIVAHTVYKYYGKILEKLPWVKTLLEKKWNKRSFADYLLNWLYKFYKMWRGGENGESGNEDL